MLAGECCFTLTGHNQSILCVSCPINSYDFRTCGACQTSPLAATRLLPGTGTIAAESRSVDDLARCASIDQEETKSGILPENLATIADQISPLPNILLRGLMIIPRTRTKFDQQRQVFRWCRMLMDELNATGHQMDQLSMGITTVRLIVE